MQTWLITGCSSGLGRSLAQSVLAHGENAVVTARNKTTVQDIIAAYPETALALALDVRDDEQIVEAVRLAEAKFGEIDVLVNNAGHGLRAAIEEAAQTEIDEVFATNFWGPVAMIKAVMPGMRLRRKGTIINVSSIAARDPGMGSGYYAATKCALEGISGALRKEVKPLGINVIVVEPGQFKTDFYGRSLMQSRVVFDDYAETAGRNRITNELPDRDRVGDPSRAGDAIIMAVESSSPPDLLLLGSDALNVVGAVLEKDRAELDAWKAISMSTDFSD